MTDRMTPLFRGTQIAWYLVGLIEIILAFRFILKFAGANPAAYFTDFIYRLSHPFVLPFTNVFRVSQIGENILEWATILAALTYWILGWAIAKLLAMSRPVSKEEAHDDLRKQDE